MFSGIMNSVSSAASSYASQAMGTLSDVAAKTPLAQNPLLAAAGEKMAEATGATTSDSAKKDEEEKEPEEPKESCGRMEFKMDYNFEKGTLAITVIQCENLPAMDLGGTSDPYVRVYILPDKKKKFATKVMKKSLNPVYNETFTFQKLPYSDIGGKTLVLDVYDYDQFGANDQIGECQVPLGMVDLGDMLQMWKDIKIPSEDVLGDICLSLRYVPQKSQLTVVVMECKNLKKMDLTGGSDPYVKLNLMHNGKRLKKHKTTTKMSDLNPYFNESFKFEVNPNLIHRVKLDVFVMDYDRVGSNDAIGHVVFGSSMDGTPKRHWMDMVNNPRRSIAQWHSLVPEEDEEEEKKKKDAEKGKGEAKKK